MTPREEAKNLLILFEERIEQNCNQSSGEAHYAAAKQCALIATDKTISTLKELPVTVGIKFQVQFQQRVKQEIEKL